nr:hypothetical protein [Alphaproteobacteria bacterium]
LPFVGGLADNLFGAEVVRNLATDHAHDPLPQNARDIYHAALASAPDALSQICWLFKTHVLGDFASYSATLPSVLMHGLWAGTPILSLLGLLHLKPLLAYSRNDQRPLPILLVFVAVISLLVFNTLLTGNQRGNNLGLVFLYTYATAYLVARMDVRRQLDEQHVASA